MTVADFFEQHRGRVFGIAYRMLGTVTDAEDVVQDVWLRWHSTDRAAVREPSAFLATITTRLCLTALDSARSRRETYVGPWLPEPLSTAPDPGTVAEHAESLNLAVLMLLERLTPAERAAYVLREAFDYPFERVAEVLEVSIVNARQLASRARRHLDRERGVAVSGVERERLLAAFTAAAQSGDLGALEAVLAEDVISISDGGGVVNAARKPVVGRERVASFLRGILEKQARGMRVTPVHANGEFAAFGQREDGLGVFWTLDFGPNGVERVLIVMNPAKLVPLRRHISVG